MIKEVSEYIRDEVFEKLDDIYNHRKHKEGLISVQNNLINRLKKEINFWVDKQIKEEEKMIARFNQEDEK